MSDEFGVGLKLEQDRILRRIDDLEIAEYTIMQLDAGVPAHVAREGTPYWDMTNDDLYVNIASGGAVWQLIGGGGGPGFPHSILSATHVDTTPAVVVRGDVMTGQGVVPTWQRLAHPGVATQFFTSGANEPTWTAITALGGVPALTYGLVDAAGVATTFVQTDASLAVFDAVAPNTIQCDDAAATGAQPFAARRDHEHAIVCAVAVNIANANAEGVATSFGRSDHVHNHPAGLGVNLHHNEIHVVNSTGPHAEAGLTIGHVLRVSGAAAFSFAAIQAGDLPGLGGVPALTLGLVNAAGAAATYVQTDASIAIFDAVVPTTIQCDDAAAAGVVAFAARRDHTHGMPTVAPVNIGVANAEGTAYDFVRSDHVHNHPAGLGANLHHNEIHVVNSTGPHAEAGLTIGHMLRVSGAAAFSFAAIQNTDVPSALDVNPGTCTVATGNVAATPHTHAITTSSNPGAAASILATGGAGALTLTGVFTAIGGVVLDDGAGNSPSVDFVGGSNDDTATLLLADNAVAGRSDLILLLCDAAGRSQFQIYSSAPALVAYIDSTGLAALAGLGIGAVPVAGGITMADGAWIGQAAGPLVTFDDTLNYLEITGCNVGIGTATPGKTLDVFGVVSFYLVTTAVTNKQLQIHTNQYDSAVETEGWLPFRTSSLINTNQVIIGGSHANYNAATLISFFTAPNVTTRTGTEKARLTSVGYFGLGTTSPDRLLHAEIADAETIVVSWPLRLTHITSGLAAVGFGVGIEFEDETDGGQDVMGQLFVKLADATHATRRATFGIDLNRQGAWHEAVRIVAADVAPLAGNARGAGSVDLQQYRTAATQIASGTYAVVSGGRGNTASSNYSTVSGGQDNVASTNTHATIGGGQSNVASANNVTVSGGFNNTATGNTDTVGGGNNNDATGGASAIGGGGGNVASGSTSVIAGGLSNTASGVQSAVGGGGSNVASGDFASIGGGGDSDATGDYSAIAGGFQALADKYGQLAHASGRFAAAGDAQGTPQFTARRSVTHSDANWYELFLDGAAARMTVAADTVWTFDTLIVGTTQGCTKSFGFRIEGTIENDGGTTTLLASTVTTIYDGDDVSFDARASADDANDALLIEVQDSDGTGDTVHWVACTRTSECSWLAA